jgi:hypothetical protein
MTIKGILFAGAALCAIATAPALAATAPKVAIFALHPGSAHVKTIRIHNKATEHTTVTLATTTSVSTAADYKVKTPLYDTYYHWGTGSSPCSGIYPEKITASTKKTAYAKIGTGVETFSTGETGCSSTDTYYGATYDLSTKSGVGKTDSFSTSLTAKLKDGKTTYDLDLVLDIAVEIGS